MRSRRIRTKSELELLRQHGRAVRLYSLRGRLIFASLEPVMRAVLEEADGSTHVILDLTQVVDLDRACCRLLFELRDRLTRQGVRTHFTGAEDKLLLRDYVTARLQEEGWRTLCEFETVDQALEACENDVLRRHGLAPHAADEAPLPEHELCRGFAVEEIQSLSERLTRVEFPAGTEVFAAGSPADAMYFLVRGEVGIFLRTSDNGEQLISRLGPGTSFGEVALVDREPRSATVRALEPIRTWRLSFDRFDRLASEGLGHLQTKLYSNLASVLAARLRSANAEIRSLK